MSNIGNKEIMAQNIKFYMDLFGKSQVDICTELGFKTNTFSDWINAKKYPRIDKIEALANYFHISKSNLIELQTEDEKLDAQIIHLFSGLNDDHKKQVLDTIRGLAMLEAKK